MRKILAYIAFVLGILQIGMVLISWLIVAAVPELGFHSLLSAEGVRWYFGKVVYNMSTQVLVATLLLSSAFGSVWKSGLADVFSHHLSYRERMAVRTVLVEFCLAVVVMLLLTAIPHAILLSVTGHLFPSSFSHSIVPVVTFVFWVMSESYAFMTNDNRNVIMDSFEDFIYGIYWAVPYIFLYLIAVQLYYSVLFVF